MGVQLEVLVAPGGARADGLLDGLRVDLDADNGELFRVVAFLVEADDDHDVVVDVGVAVLLVAKAEARDVVLFRAGDAVVVDERGGRRDAVDDPVRYVVVLDDLDRLLDAALVHHPVADPQTRLVLEERQPVVALPEPVAVDDLGHAQVHRLGAGRVRAHKRQPVVPDVAVRRRRRRRVHEQVDPLVSAERVFRAPERAQVLHHRRLQAVGERDPREDPYEAP